MSLSAAAIRMLADKGLSACDIADVAEANEPERTSSAARQKRYRDRKRNERDVTRDVTPPLNDIYSNPPVPQSSNDDCPPLAVRIVESYNEVADRNGLTPARAMTPGRRKHLNARLKEHGEAALFEAIRKLGESDWHCGRKPGSDWKADLGWMLKTPDNFLKILERQDGPRSVSNGPKLSAEEQRAYVEHVAQKFGRMSPSATPPAERVGKPITLASLAAAQVGGHH